MAKTSQTVSVADQNKLDGLILHGFEGRTGSSLSMTDTVLTLTVPSAQQADSL